MNELLLKRLEHLSPERRELVLKRLNAASGQGEQAAVIPSVSGKQTMPLSSAQTRLWFLDQQLESRRDIYNVPLFLQLHGHLQVTDLERAMAEIVQRHEILRTTFSDFDGAPVQVITPNPTLPLTMIDLQTLPETKMLAEAHRLANEELQKPLDLAHGPLLRVTLLRLNRNAHVLLVVMHHIVCDGWSMGVFSRELAALYAAFCAGQPSPLPALTLQYADFAHWQQQTLSGDTLQTQRHYWQRQLAGIPPPAGTPHRPAAPVYAIVSGAECIFATRPRANPEPAAFEPSSGGNPVYDPARSVCHPTLTLLPSRRCGRRLTHCQSQPAGA